MRLSFAARAFAVLSLLSASAVAFAAAPIDLSTREGFASACAAAPAKAALLKSNEEKISYVICRDTALTKQIATWIFQGLKRMEKERNDSATIIAEVVREIDYARGEMAVTRKVLDQVKLGKRTSLTIAPGLWELDLDSDGKVDLWEKHFFAIPRRGNHEFRFSAPSNDPAYYEREYNVNAVIKLDQSDILWAQAYHHFLEGFLTNLRAFDLTPKFDGLIIARPELLKQAHQLIGRGMALSAEMRQSVLAETDDDHEWIGNPKQASSVFPIPLDQADFDSWGAIMKELIALWQGRSLLPTTERGSGLLAEVAPLCPPGMGLDIAATYQQPPPAGTRLSLGSRANLSPRHCKVIDAAHPVSSLPDLIQRAQKTDAGMRFLRYLYWTN